MYVETTDGRTTPASLGVLAEGRRAATTIGGVLYALVIVKEDGRQPARHHHAAVIDTLGRAGADRILLIPNAASEAPIAWHNRGACLIAACERARPSLVYAAATPATHDMMPRLASMLRAAYVPEATVSCDGTLLLLCSHAFAGRYERRLRADQVLHPVVATLRRTNTPASQGSAKVAAEFLPAPIAAPSTIAYVDSALDPGAPLESAQVVVSAGAGITTAEDYQLIQQLAALMGGAPAATRSLCATGIAPTDNEVDVGNRYISPRLYLACGASGSPQHLGAIGPDTRIVAINRDASANIFAAAQVGIVGDAPEIIRAMIDTLSAQREAP